jgi:hypothetical protein
MSHKYCETFEGGLCELLNAYAPKKFCKVCKGQIEIFKNDAPPQPKRVGLATCKKKKELDKVRVNIGNLICGELMDRRLDKCRFCDNRKGSTCTKGKFWITVSGWLKEQKCPDDIWRC